MKIDKNTIFADFIYAVDLFNIGDSKILEIIDRMKDYPLKELFSKSFNELTFGQLVELHTSIKTVEDMLFVPFRVVYNIEKENVFKLKAFDCIRFAIHSKNEIERITKLFESIRYKPSGEEIRAGINKVSGGFFRTADWYAKRMNIQDHEEVFNLSWMRIYECMKIDFEDNRFQNNYRKIISNGRGKNKASR